MVLQVKNNPEHLEKGEIVVFFTGAKSINTLPKFMRVGEVLQGYGVDCQVRELSTGKVWHPYSGDIIQVGKGIPVQGVSAVLKFTENP